MYIAFSKSASRRASFGIWQHPSFTYPTQHKHDERVDVVIDNAVWLNCSFSCARVAVSESFAWLPACMTAYEALHSTLTLQLSWRGLSLLLAVSAVLGCTVHVTVTGRFIWTMVQF